MKFSLEAIIKRKKKPDFGRDELPSIIESIDPVRIAWIWQNFLKEVANNANRTPFLIAEYRNKLIAELREQQNSKTKISPSILFDNSTEEDLDEMGRFFSGNLKVYNSRHVVNLPELKMIRETEQREKLQTF